MLKAHSQLSVRMEQRTSFYLFAEVKENFHSSGAGGGLQRAWRVSVCWAWVSVRDGKQVWEMDGGGGCTIMNALTATEPHTFKYNS